MTEQARGNNERGQKGWCFDFSYNNVKKKHAGKNKLHLTEEKTAANQVQFYWFYSLMCSKNI